MRSQKYLKHYGVLGDIAEVSIKSTMGHRRPPAYICPRAVRFPCWAVPSTCGTAKVGVDEWHTITSLGRWEYYHSERLKYGV